ncbi:MAG TPA: EamA family transporter [Gemmatimonadaceae bacterium]
MTPTAAGASPAPSRARMVAAFATVYIVWGSPYLAIKYAIATIPPFLMAGSRFLLAGALLYAFALRGGGPAPTRRQWLNASVIGILLLGLGNGGVVWAELLVPSGLAALLVAAMPVWMVLFEALRPEGRRPTALVVAGIMLGLFGQAVLVGPSSHGAGSQSVSLVGVAALLIATMSWAAGSIRARLVDLPASRVRTTAMEMLAGGAALLVVGAAVGEVPQFLSVRPSTASIAAWLYLVVFGSLLAFTAFVWLNATVAPARAATYAYVNPIVAVGLGWLLLGEPVTSRTVVAAVIILGAVLVINVAGSRAPARSAKAPPESRTETGDATAPCTARLQPDG